MAGSRILEPPRDLHPVTRQQGQVVDIQQRVALLERSQPRRYAFLAAGSGTATAGSATTTKFNYATEVSDPDSCYSLSPDYAFVAPYSGLFCFQAGLAISGAGGLTANTRLILSLYSNGSAIRTLEAAWSATAWSNDNFMKGSSGVVVLAAGDKVDVRLGNSGASFTFGGSSAVNTYFCGSRV